MIFRTGSFIEGDFDTINLIKNSKYINKDKNIYKGNLNRL